MRELRTAINKFGGVLKYIKNDDEQVRKVLDQFKLYANEKMPQK
jgi:hypothetical protein